MIRQQLKIQQPHTIVIRTRTATAIRRLSIVSRDVRLRMMLHHLTWYQQSATSLHSLETSIRICRLRTILRPRHLRRLRHHRRLQQIRTRLQHVTTALLPLTYSQNNRLRSRTRNEPRTRLHHDINSSLRLKRLLSSVMSPLARLLHWRN